MSFQSDPNQKVIRNPLFEEKADALKPKIYQETITPNRVVKTITNEDIIHGWEVVPTEDYQQLATQSFGKGESFILDFGQHVVGYVSMNVSPVGSPPDAPLHVRFTFGEMPVEVSEPFSSYDGWISSSWLQEETLHVDVLPNKIKLPRRYSFRYMKVEILDTSQKFNVSFNEVRCQAVTSADVSNVKQLNHEDPLLNKLDEVSIKTLQDCMQDVFEDGPKRDRRLWLGDLRLQALANYVTFKNNDLVKRNLYQFATVPNENGQVTANLFVEPTLIPDDTFLFDYSLFFTTTLFDYYQVTKDKETLVELWGTAYRQIELALERVKDNGIVKDDSSWWSFIDWHPDLNKQGPSQAILIYALKRAINLANELGETEEEAYLTLKVETMTMAAKTHLWNEKAGFFVSGESKQISWATQVWMVLAEVLDKEASRKLLQNLLVEKPEIGMNTPYMYHHLAEALFLTGETEEAIKLLKHYWGGMIKDGADTFWELYNPEDKEFSPYGNHLINSFCHAWSCTPTYLLRTFLDTRQS
ncbi:sugar hydrolase [Salipaludibacillus neizhouensis]|uniref:Sugar hydrolase n=1 Tax=Salipaludibacillus neizhouensis TaxID=885475 RepID=A0A3A9K1E8_9BACI|nr:family 78 glycoside hydrolase catalytic domain [Salipaludibacillus neizhouensis]RKL66924.1 sugar hydrolase [Salipaludibacillus neizhouensis]